jgi:hypothetical protein
MKVKIFFIVKIKSSQMMREFLVCESERESESESEIEVTTD